MAKRVVILDTSVLSAFAKIGRLELLKTILEGYRVLIPESVYRELCFPELLEIATEPNGSAQKAAWIRVESAEETTREHASLGRGEAGVLHLVKKHKAIAVLDDLAARKQAKEEGTPVSGTLGLLKKAATKGLIDKKEFRAIIADLEWKDSFYLSENLKSSLLE